MQDYIKIEDAQINEEAFINYTLYVIKVSRNDQEFTIHRRYNDFTLLKEAFNRNWPACFIPPLPQKKHIGNLEANVIAYRSKYLAYFLKKVISLPYLWQSKEMEYFLHSPERLNELLKSGSLEDLVVKYEATFQFVAKHENDIEIDRFTQFINTTLPMITNFQRMAKNVMKAKDGYNLEEINFVEVFLPQFERIQMITEDQVFSNQDLKQQYADLKHYQHKNEFIKIYDYTKAAERELLACKDALSQRYAYVSKQREESEKLVKLQISLQEIHTKSIPTFWQSKEDKQQQLKTQIASQELYLEQLKQFNKQLDMLLTQQEIPNFMKLNKIKYQEMIKALAEFKLKSSQASVDFWQSILMKL